MTADSSRRVGTLPGAMGTDKRARQKEMSRTRAEEARKGAAALARRKRVINLSLVTLVVAALVALIVFVSGDDDSTDTAAEDDTTTTQPAATTTPGDGAATTVAPVAIGTAECPAADGTSERMETFDGAPKMCIDPTKAYSAEVETSEGNFTISLDAAKAPNTVNNFVFLSRYHFYDGVIFHRIIKDFMFQGGDPEGTGTGGPGYEFNDELPQQGEYQKYSVAMANSGPNTNGSQFFVITGDQGVSLPPSYSLFGQVVDGTDVADRIGVVETGAADKPVKDVTIEKITITEG